MPITTRESVSGFIASAPQLSFTQNGDARFYARIGQEHARRKDDGSFTPLEPTFTDLIMFGKSAERAYSQFQKGDAFIADGQARTYTQNVDNKPVKRDQFVARRIGHDNNLTTYVVDRPRPERDRLAPTIASHEPAGEDPD
ncbi:single-stranded DNA-binding protein [Rathayibacter soli]|uniref:single-stranded DNA-binding protein n=1 Tax=Rathayibacter soli TaxID=3144168 RepID=UPI0027E513CF|nr:single-stranded DNA-binding protein [Glaciibacter superstes]